VVVLVAVGIEVGVAVTVGVDVYVGDGVAVGVGDGVAVAVMVGVGEGVAVAVGDGVAVAVHVGEGVSVNVDVGSTTGKGVGVLRIAPQAHLPARQVATGQTTSSPNTPISIRFWMGLSPRGPAAVINDLRPSSTGASGVGSPS
jgi:hypothetical protein